MGFVNELSEILSRDRSQFPLDINSKLLDDWTALHLASNENHFQIIDILLNNGGNVEAQTTIKRTALHIAAFRGYLKAVETLIKHSANVNAQDCEENTPLHFASERGFGEIVEFLLEKGANYKLKNIFKRNPIDLSLNEETRRVYDKFLKQGEKHENIDFLEGVPRIGGRNNFVSHMLYFMSLNEITNKEKISEEETKGNLEKNHSKSQGSKIIKIMMGHEEKENTV